MRPAPHSWSAPNRKGLAGTSGICDHAGRARPEASRSKGAGKGGASVARTEAEMSTTANAWVAFIRALEDARDMQHRGAEAHTIADLLRHARDCSTSSTTKLSMGHRRPWPTLGQYSRSFVAVSNL